MNGEVDTDELELLKTALSVLIGTEAMIAMRDVLRLDHEQARASGEWAVRQMVRSVRQPTDSAHRWNGADTPHPGEHECGARPRSPRHL